MSDAQRIDLVILAGAAVILCVSIWLMMRDERTPVPDVFRRAFHAD